MKLSSLSGRLAVCLLWGSVLVPGQVLSDFEKTVTEFSLPSGIHFIIVERHEAPVVSFNTYVNAGSVDDPPGKTGIAHMMEHMAFKGTQTIGTKNWPGEKKALAEIERAYDRLDAERKKGAASDPKKVAALEAGLKQAIDKADSFVVPSEYDKIVEQNGGVGLNAGTGEDSTNYYYSFPANRTELWFLLESERFLQPVFREFYKERDVVREERRMRVESSGQGLLVEKMLMTAFTEHPYRITPGGLARDIENFRMPEAFAFFHKYYVPPNITVGIAGDVDPNECKRFAEKYFGRLPVHAAPPRVAIVEPEQKGERRVSLENKEQPILIMAYKRPDRSDPDDLALDAASEILAGGRTSLMYRELVRDQKVALAAGAQSSFPGDKYPNLFLIYVVPNMGKTIGESEKASLDLVERIKTRVEPDALERVKTKLRAGLIRRLDSNSGLAGDLTYYHVAFGNWKRMFTDIQDMQKITADDVMRVARKYLVAEHRTVAWTYQPAQPKEGK
jgi:predicted Zn-dependent peptidase